MVASQKMGDPDRPQHSSDLIGLPQKIPLSLRNPHIGRPGCSHNTHKNGVIAITIIIVVTVISITITIILIVTIVAITITIMIMTVN